jgi:hypothetical protein
MMSEQGTTKHLSELQRARQLWLDAETRAMEAEARAAKWQRMYFELQQKMTAQAVQHMCDHLAAPWVALAAEIRSKS